MKKQNDALAVVETVSLLNETKEAIEKVIEFMLLEQIPGLITKKRLKDIRAAYERDAHKIDKKLGIYYRKVMQEGNDF